MLATHAMRQLRIMHYDIAVVLIFFCLQLYPFFYENVLAYTMHNELQMYLFSSMNYIIVVMPIFLFLGMKMF